MLLTKGSIVVYVGFLLSVSLSLLYSSSSSSSCMSSDSDRSVTPRIEGMLYLRIENALSFFGIMLRHSDCRAIKLFLPVLSRFLMAERVLGSSKRSLSMAGAFLSKFEM